MEKPASVQMATRLMWVVIGLSGVTALVTILLRDDLVRSWAEGNRTAALVLEEGGLEALERSSISVPAFVPLALVSFGVLAMLGWVLVAFFRAGHGWARWALVLLAVFAAFVAALAFTRNPPLPFVVLSVVSLGVCGALLYYLLHRDTGAFLRRS